MKGNQKLIESYNKCIEKALSELASSNVQGEISNDRINETIDYCDNNWSVTHITELDDRSPNEIVNEIYTTEDIKELYEYACTNTFYHIPSIIDYKVKSLGKIGLNYLHELINTDVIKINIHDSDAIPEDSMNKVNIALSAINSLSYFKDDSSIDILIKMWCNCHPSNEVFLEKISDTLSKFGMKAMECIIDILNQAENIGCKEEYLMQAFCAIDYKMKTDSIFFCIKNCFRKMENKVLGAMLIGDYGDGRAVPILRKYVISDMNLLSKEEFYIFITVIKKLGGQTDDLINIKK